MRKENIVAVALFVVLMALSVACGVQRYNECRRIHPWWYCMGGK
jgi:hypothetical protein